MGRAAGFRIHGGAILLAGLMLAGCGGDGAADAAASEQVLPGAVPGASAEFVRGQEAWRAARREELLAPGGWTSLIGLHWIELPAHYVGSGDSSGLRLALGPPRLGMLQQREGHLYFTPERGVPVTLNDEPLSGRVQLHSDRSDTPSVIGYDEGRGAITVIERGGRHALRVRHLDAPARRDFGDISYWPMDPDWQVQAHFEPHPPGRTLEMASIVGGIEALPNPGAVVFERDGGTYRLEALEGEEGGLFLVLSDRTNGQGSYGAGRYLYTAAPDAGGNVMLDFNRLENPPCAFTDYAVCPLPPAGNRLDLAITAGEKLYAPGRTAPALRQGDS